MVIPNDKMIDSHVHLDNIYYENPDRISWLTGRQCILISWTYSNHVENIHDLENYLRDQSSIIRQLNETPLECYYLTGVHPRNIPADLKPEKIPELLIPYLEDPLCLGIGEIGLETGEEKEVEVFQAHLEMFREVIDRNLKYGVHTPRNDKSPITDQILNILTQYPRIKDHIVIDHCMPDTIGRIFEAGYFAGVTISSNKASADDLQEILRKAPTKIDRIMLNSDSGTLFYPEYYDLIHSGILPAEIHCKLTFENAASFFHIK